MRMKKRLLALAVVALAAVESPAYASDFKVMPGSACQPRLMDDRQDVVVLLDGVTNIHPTDPAFVICPIVRDNTSTNPNGVMLVNLVVHGSSVGDKVECLLDSRNAQGTVNPITNLPVARDEGSAGGATTASSTGFAHLILDVPQNPRRDGYYVVQCKLPAGQPGGTVASYQYFELSPTDDNN
jgi:hypothetical protein